MNLLGDHVAGALGHAAHGVDALDHGRHVVAAGGAFLEMVKIDFGRVTRVGGAQADAAGGVVGVGLEHRPGEMIAVAGDVARVAR